MKKLFIVLAIAFSLSGCAQLGTVLNLSTKSVANPVTKTDLYNVENAMTVAFAALNAYRKACLSNSVDTHCRANIQKIQVYTRQIPPLLASLRSFVKNNDQINAVVAYNTITGLIANFKAAAAANGVQVQ